MNSPGRHLRRLARSYGVQLDYTDPNGRLQVASPESLIAVLGALGCEIARPEDAADASRARRAQQWRQLTEPVHVAWDGRGWSLGLRLPGSVTAPRIGLHLLTDSGEAIDWEARFEAQLVRTANVNGEIFRLHRIALPPVLPPGYHHLHGEIGPHRFETLIVAAPQAAFRGDVERGWGAFMPLYALRSRPGMGSGDYSDLGALLRWVHDLGGHTVGTLPILPAFLDECYEPSPYVPMSRLFWNEFYLDVTAAPELQQSDAARAVLESTEHATAVEALRAASLVDYAATMRARRAVLEPLARSFFAAPVPARRAAYDRFLSTRPRLLEYARFRAASERHRTPWIQWPAAQRNGKLEEGDVDRDRVQYHAYAQWLAHEQLSAAAGTGRRHGAGLYLDFPVGVNAIGFDTWRHRDSFALGTRVGAPPDTLFTQGQDWGFPPLHPEGLRQSGYSYLRACLRHHMSVAKHLRVDHVMGLHRLFWIPPDCDTPRGVYVCYRPEEMYAVMSLESHRSRCALVGENLGIVPARVERAMQRHSLRRLYVMQFALYDGPERLTPPAPDAVASLNTHDMPTFASFWRGLDIDDRLGLQFVNAEQAAAEHAARADLRARFGGWLATRAGVPSLPEGEEGTRLALEGCLDFLARSPASMVLVALEDLWLESEPHNVPSTWRERPNWMRKARYTLEELRTHPDVVRLLHAMRSQRGNATTLRA